MTERKSRKLRSGRRRNILRTLSRKNAIGPLSEVSRGETQWLHSPEMARAKQDVDAENDG